MNKKLTLKKSELEKAKQETGEYWFVILEKYFELWDADPENVIENFTDAQHVLLAYNTLYGEVMNGGFVQLICNGYGDYIFESPVIETLKKWGASETAEILEDVRDLYRQDKIKCTEDDSLEYFLNLYEDNPEFEQFDNDFYAHDELEIVKNYIEKHLDKFILVE